MPKMKVLDGAGKTKRLKGSQNGRVPLTEILVTPNRNCNPSAFHLPQCVGFLDMSGGNTTFGLWGKQTIGKPGIYNIERERV